MKQNKIIPLLAVLTASLYRNGQGRRIVQSEAAKISLSISPADLRLFSVLAGFTKKWCKNWQEKISSEEHVVMGCTGQDGEL
jgi:hypothetical protein